MSQTRRWPAWATTLVSGLVTHLLVWHWLFYDTLVREPRAYGRGPWAGEVMPMYLGSLLNLVLPVSEFGLFALERSVPLALLAMLLVHLARLVGRARRRRGGNPD